MTLGEIFSPLTAVIKLVLSFLGRGSHSPHKRLEARLVLRAIVSELPHSIPFYICDENGVRYKGVYAIGLLIWNKGNQAVTHSDFTTSSPLQVKVGRGANLIGARIVAAEGQTVTSATITNPTTLTLNFDCVNPNEYLVVSIFLTGNSRTDIQVTGRIIGQENPIDHTAEEVRASFGERLSALCHLIIIMSLPGLFISGGLILKDYGISAFIHNPDIIPKYLMFPFGFGVMTFYMFGFSRVMNWNERRKYPAGYPLYADLEPPLFENVRGLIRTVFKAKKQWISVSIFDWGKPVLMPSKEVKRRTVDDWIK